MKIWEEKNFWQFYQNVALINHASTYFARKASCLLLGQIQSEFKSVPRSTMIDFSPKNTDGFQTATNNRDGKILALFLINLICYRPLFRVILCYRCFIKTSLLKYVSISLTLVCRISILHANVLNRDCTHEKGCWPTKTENWELDIITQRSFSRTS